MAFCAAKGGKKYIDVNFRGVSPRPLGNGLLKQYKERIFVKRFQKYLWVLAMTAALLCIAVYGSPRADSPLPGFVVQTPDGSHTQTVSIYDAKDGNYYLFLPSYADQQQLIVSQTHGQRFFIDNTLLWEGMDFGSFHSETPYPFAVDGQQIGALWLFKSANVATLYIDTVSGNMKYLHQNKEHQETVSVRLYTDAGSLNYANELSVLTGRGNMTWNYDKRPYTLTLPADGALLDMPPGAKWVLLANAADETNLNNKLVFDLAREVGFQWTPECRWTDLYLNGEYSGLYLLTEKVEVHENRLAIDTNSGDFLCKIDLEERWSTLRNPFLTGAGRTVEICEPKILKAGDQARVEQLTQALEQELFSGADLSQSAVMDLDSWVRRYLLDEISANIDGDLASAYFHCRNGVIFAGPLWDYDMTFGNYPRNQDPRAFVAKNAQKSDTLLSPYYGALYENASFRRRASELYRTEFVPALQKLMTQELDVLMDSLHDASQSNSLRWRAMYDHLPGGVVHTPAALKEYLTSRIQFLDSAWVDNTGYCTVQFESAPGTAYKAATVERGQILETPYINTDTALWLRSETGEVFDFRQPIMEDMILSRQVQDSTDTPSAHPAAAFSRNDLFLILLLCVPLITVTALAVIDAGRGRKHTSQPNLHR